MAAELLPATFPSKEAAENWSRHVKHEVLDIVENDKGRWQVKIDRKPQPKS